MHGREVSIVAEVAAARSRLGLPEMGRRVTPVSLAAFTKRPMNETTRKN